MVQYFSLQLDCTKLHKRNIGSFFSDTTLSIGYVLSQDVFDIFSDKKQKEYKTLVNYKPIKLSEYRKLKQTATQNKLSEKEKLLYNKERLYRHFINYLRNRIYKFYNPAKKN